MKLAPIILFVYNRLEHTKQTVQYLQENTLAADSELYIFADGAKDNANAAGKKKVNDVRDYIHTITGFKAIHIEEAPKNKGLANSVISGVTMVMNECGKAIVVEDDIISNRFFLQFMNDCLEKYKGDKKIYSIGAYSYDIRFPYWFHDDIYVAPRVESWGWATWKDRWDTADWEVKDYDKLCHNSRMRNEFRRGGRDLWHMLRNQMDGKIDSWAVRWHYSMYKQEAYCIYPVKGFAQNIGFDGSGVHCSTDTTGERTGLVASSNSYDIAFPVHLKLDSYIERSFYVYWRNKRISMFHRIYHTIRHYL